MLVSKHTMTHSSLDQLLLQIRQQVKQIAVLQALLATRREVGEEGEIEAKAPKFNTRSNTRSNVKVIKLPIFNGNVSRIADFIIVYKLYIRMKIRKVSVEKQVQWILLYIQGGSADI